MIVVHVMCDMYISVHALTCNSSTCTVPFKQQCNAGDENRKCRSSKNQHND